MSIIEFVAKEPGSVERVDEFTRRAHGDAQRACEVTDLQAALRRTPDTEAK